MRSPAVQEAGTAGHGTNQGLDLGYNEAAGAGQMDLLHLYVILDIFGRYVVCWMVAPCKTAGLVKRLILHTRQRQTSPALSPSTPTEKSQLQAILQHRCRRRQATPAYAFAKSTWSCSGGRSM